MSDPITASIKLITDGPGNPPLSATATVPPPSNAAGMVSAFGGDIAVPQHGVTPSADAYVQAFSPSNQDIVSPNQIVAVTPGYQSQVRQYEPVIPQGVPHALPPKKVSPLIYIGVGIGAFFIFKKHL